MDSLGDVDSDGRWMTYAALAEVRGTTRASAERMARRAKWRRQLGNDKIARVFVPLAVIERAGDKSKERQGDTAPRAPDAFEKAIALLSEQLAREVARGDALRIELDRAQAAARAAQEALEELRRTNDARKARGVLRRVLAAVRRE